MEESYQLHAPTNLTPGETVTYTCWTGSWVDPRDYLDCSEANKHKIIKPTWAVQIRHIVIAKYKRYVSSYFLFVRKCRVLIPKYTSQKSKLKGIQRMLFSYFIIQYN